MRARERKVASYLPDWMGVTGVWHLSKGGKLLRATRDRDYLLLYSPFCYHNVSAVVPLGSSSGVGWSVWPTGNSEQDSSFNLHGSVQNSLWVARIDIHLRT